MFDFITSDGAILVLTTIGLALTTLSIVSDARAQHQVSANDDQYAEDVAA